MKPPPWFWVVAVLALLWNLLGAWMFWQNLAMTPEALAALPDAQRQVTLARPHWTFVPFGIGTLGGVLGALGLLLRRRWAVPVLLLSLLGIAVLFAAMYAATPVWALTGVRGAVFPIVLVLIGGLLWLYARKSAARGWLR
ncbi:hypothetical protein E2F46_08965 [Luteimonas aestuarii]|uniref:Sugar transporter n=1 Tax=Luteimonas aestuarii TaxID=453837 RepID=A0A4R5TTR2_9GAMM|nr:hypothetical protein [Luteimonas aestuarii]TDK24399.1 hypothetical protein E2F46_08965 [Luteimonas aestuarii]